MHCIQLNNEFNIHILAQLFFFCVALISGFHAAERGNDTVTDARCVFLVVGREGMVSSHLPVCPWCCLLQMCKQCIII